MARIFDNISDFFRPLSGAQKALFGLLSAGVIILMVMLFYWALQPNYAVLFQSLSSESAQSIVEKLQSSDVSYKLADNGHTIKVPQSQVYDLRLKYAEEGSSGNEYEGYKLFDKNSLGMTDFMQRINKKRALEGELARTINSLKQVKSSRIHIVLPKRSPFQETKVKASSSVVLELQPNQTLNDKQISGITALIAGSVEKLKSGEVTILDQDGNEISKNGSDENLAANSRQMQVREGAENYLSRKGQSMLDRVVGPGNSILRVSTEHNFKKITRQSNTIDPASRTIISEEKHQQTNSNKTQDKSRIRPSVANNSQTTKAQQNNSTVNIKNYEISKTNEHSENLVGGIKRISASVLLNYKTKTAKNKNGEKVTKFVPHSKQELAEIKQAIHAALGINQKRGDEITITQMKFQDPYSLNPQTGSFFGDSFSLYQLIRWILTAAVAAVLAYLMYRTSQNVLEGGFDTNNFLQGRSESGNQNALGPKTGEEDIYASKLSQEAREELNKPSKEQHDIDEFVEAHTSQAANLVRLLMKQGV